MKIGVAGPFLSSELVEFLEERYRSAPNLPKGSGGTPINFLVRGLIARGRRVTLFTTDCNITEEVILNGPRLRICMGPYRLGDHKVLSWLSR